MTVLQLIWLAVAGIVTLVLERIVTAYLRRFAKRQHLERRVSNSLVLTFRMILLIAIVVVVIIVGGISPEAFLAFSALGGAAVGFASTQTLGNFVAGLYLLATRPFKVGDFVRVGTVEGIVQELTINYAKIETIGNNFVSIANLQVLQIE
jgi:small-conductance mechanosensitive channel